MWRPVTAHALATVLRDDPAAWEKARDDSLEILDKNNRDAFGDRGLAWAALLLCRPEDPAVLGFVCDIIRTDPHYVHFLGHAPLPAAYAGHPSVAQAIEDSLRADPHAYMDSELHALAGIDHGPAMKDALLKSLTSGSFPHWAAGALAARWDDDEEARAALRAVLEGEPVRASYAAAAAVPRPRPRGSSGAAARPARHAPQRPAADPAPTSSPSRWPASTATKPEPRGRTPSGLPPPAWNSCPIQATSTRRRPRARSSRPWEQPRQPATAPGPCSPGLRYR